jgi:hypothetical protein
LAVPAPRLVFVQYLAGLAIVRACRDGRALGAERGARVRLKWPNDVYVDLPSSSVAEGEKKKVGGVLVNMNFADGNADLIIGALYPSYARAWPYSGIPFAKIELFVFFGRPGQGVASTCVPPHL